MNTLYKIRNAERKSHESCYENNRLFEEGSWLAKPVSSVMDIFPLLNKESSVKILDLGCGVGRNCIPAAQFFSKIELGISWKLRNRRGWMEWYQDAKLYYETYGHLNIPLDYVTKDGFRLGSWINSQRERQRGTRFYLLESEKVEKLNQINCTGEDLNRGKQSAISGTLPKPHWHVRCFLREKPARSCWRGRCRNEVFIYRHSGNGRTGKGTSPRIP